MRRREKTTQLLRNAVTKRQLLEMLEHVDDDAPIFITSDYGDYHHTEQILQFGEVEEKTAADLYDSAYSHSGVALRREDHEDDQDDAGLLEQPVFVIRCDG